MPDERVRLQTTYVNRANGRSVFAFGTVEERGVIFVQFRYRQNKTDVAGRVSLDEFVRSYAPLNRVPEGRSA
ncbi:MAG: hypothetical protein HYW25_05040 [Candidatus Aenigmarchaeota archaeon]|nr:hypothetical protein [Candidatus Aenigmarchaeota archaeon]